MKEVVKEVEVENEAGKRRQEVDDEVRMEVGGG